MNPKLKVYWTGIEFELKKTHSDFRKLKGGFVYAFVSASDKSDALIKFKKELDINQLIPTEFEFVKVYEDLEWENESQEKHFETILGEAMESMDVILDDFYMYERNEKMEN